MNILVGGFILQLRPFSSYYSYSFGPCPYLFSNLMNIFTFLILNYLYLTVYIFIKLFKIVNNLPLSNKGSVDKTHYDRPMNRMNGILSEGSSAKYVLHNVLDEY